MSERKKILATILAVTTLVVVPSLSFAPSDPDARCRDVITHRDALRSGVVADDDALAPEVARCRESLTQAQAECATSARALDEFERCFM